MTHHNRLSTAICWMSDVAYFTVRLISLQNDILMFRFAIDISHQINKYHNISIIIYFVYIWYTYNEVYACYSSYNVPKLKKPH